MLQLTVTGVIGLVMEHAQLPVAMVLNQGPANVITQLQSMVVLTALVMIVKAKHAMMEHV